MDRGAWRAAVHGIAKSQTRLRTRPPRVWDFHWWGCKHPTERKQHKQGHVRKKGLDMENTRKIKLCGKDWTPKQKTHYWWLLAVIEHTGTQQSLREGWPPPLFHTGEQCQGSTLESYFFIFPTNCTYGPLSRSLSLKVSQLFITDNWTVLRTICDSKMATHKRGSHNFQSMLSLVLGP